MTGIYLDENLSEYVADALNSLNKGYFRDVNVYSTKVKFGKGVPDEQIIPEIGKAKGVLITKDTNIRRKSMQYQLCEKYKLGVFFLKPSKGMDRHWTIVKMLIENWEEIIGIVTKERFPFGYELPTRGRMRRL
jgi:ribosomal protein L7Ae-like RNA K-turn-binding protein